jgi:catechol-2,3-dioxygenase
MSLGAAVIAVSDLARSCVFYRQLLALDVELEMDDAVLLAGKDGSHLVLRKLEHATRASGVLGVQYLIWNAEDDDDLKRSERALEAMEAHVSTWTGQGITTVEGRDPDRLPILVTGPSGRGARHIAVPLRAFSY